MSVIVRNAALVLTVAVLAGPGFAQTTPVRGNSELLLVCDFESNDWWSAWGSRRQPVNTVLVDGDQAFGGAGHSLRVTTPRGEHMGTSFAYKFQEQLGA